MLTPGDNDRTLPTSNLLKEIPPDMAVKFGELKAIRTRVDGEVGKLFEKGRIDLSVMPPATPDKQIAMWIFFNILPLFEKRLKRGSAELNRYVANHAFKGSTPSYEFSKEFDLEGDLIEKAATDILLELEEANRQTSTEKFAFKAS